MAAMNNMTRGTAAGDAPRQWATAGPKKPGRTRLNMQVAAHPYVFTAERWERPVPDEYELCGARPR